jgi:hypothetical protein
MLQFGSSPHPFSGRANSVIPERIRGEFREMPGLTLTAAQACRLWCLDLATCMSALTQLIEAGFLRRKADGTYGRASDLTRPRIAKRGVPLSEIDQPRRPISAER